MGSWWLLLSEVASVRMAALLMMLASRSLPASVQRWWWLPVSAVGSELLTESTGAALWSVALPPRILP